MRDYLLKNGTVIQEGCSKTEEGGITAYNLDGKIYLHFVSELGEGIFSRGPADKAPNIDERPTAVDAAMEFLPTAVSPARTNIATNTAALVSIVILRLLWRVMRFFIVEIGRQILHMAIPRLGAEFSSSSHSSSSSYGSRTKTYAANVRLPSGFYQRVTVQADDPFNAKAMLEAQYGKGSFLGYPQQVD